MRQNLLLAVILAALLPRAPAQAYPQYAARYNILQCTACHVNPTGGGPRTLDGKRFGSFGYPMHSSVLQNYVSAELRIIYYAPEKASTDKGGLGVMQGALALRLPLDEAERVQLVLEHNIAGFQQASFFSTYGLFKLGEKDKYNLFDSLIIGRFQAPFGVMIDEHRTYVRIQTNTQYFTMETGFLASGEPSQTVHYDLAVVNGETSSGSSLGAGQALRWGAVGNVRWMTSGMLLGASVSYHDHGGYDDSTKAMALYAILPVGRWTDDRVPLTMTFEGTRASKWNQVLNRDFADANYVTTVAQADSLGMLALLEWSLSLRAKLQYKFDFLAPDQSFPSDWYARHGAGLRYFFAPNANVLSRIEYAQATNPSEAARTTTAAQSAYWAMLQLSY